MLAAVSRRHPAGFPPSRTEDQDRRFAADPLGVPVNETIENVVAHDGQPVAGKPGNQGDQAVPQNGKAMEPGL